MKKILFYTNQFFGQIGGEEAAYQSPFLQPGPKGSAAAFSKNLIGAKISATIICGDNYFVEHKEDCLKFIREQLENYQPDLLIAGPAFNAGRFGIACGEVCSAADQFGIPSLTGFYHENPAVEMYRKYCYILKTGKNAASFKNALSLITNFANKLIAETGVGLPEEEQYYPRGKRINIFHDKTGAQRAIEMLLQKLNRQEYKSELEISSYEKIIPAPPLDYLNDALIALCTTGGIVPQGNPDHLSSASAKFWKPYALTGEEGLKAGFFESVHAGYDPVYANEDPNRIAPYNILQQMEKEKKIGKLFPYLITTTGNSTSVSDAERMGAEIAQFLSREKVDGVLLTST